MSEPAEDQAIGPREIVRGALMQLLIRGDDTVIAATIQSDVDGIP
ncbi:hypothetical protein [Mycobacterium sp. 236(2023)]|nr:hypothetical protein [Mycobacterium sp. 236(2023)]MDG4666066.1 hypothetical protein [Mycobacterium sp. 236(2023)]